jgi:hypothetical protein
MTSLRWIDAVLRDTPERNPECSAENREPG